ncbi:MAG: hypothetical protein WKF37_24375 [Bryobacteraceae bacterium]
MFNAGELAAGGQGDERALVLTDESLKATRSYKFRYFARGKDKTAKFYISSLSANPNNAGNSLVLWRNGSIQFRKADRSPGAQQPLFEAMTLEGAKRIGFGTRSDGGAIGAQEFATSGNSSLAIEIKMPEGAAAGELQLEAELAPGSSNGTVLRVTLSDTDGAAKGRPVSTLLADLESPGYAGKQGSWRLPTNCRRILKARRPHPIKIQSRCPLTPPTISRSGIITTPS